MLFKKEIILFPFLGKFTCLEVVFKFKRRLGYYLFHTYVPTCLIVIMSWISFWIKPEAVPARVTLGVTRYLSKQSLLIHKDGHFACQPHSFFPTRHWNPYPSWTSTSTSLQKTYSQRFLILIFSFKSPYLVNSTCKQSKVSSTCFLHQSHWCLHVWLHSVCVPILDGVCPREYCHGGHCRHWKEEIHGNIKPNFGY